MEIKKKYLTKYLHDIAIEQIADEYVKMGYAVGKEVMLGKFIADIIAEKGDEKIVIEVKSAKLTAEKKQQLAGLADYVNNLGGYKFLVVLASPPKEKNIELRGIEQLITDYIHNELPSSLDGLSTHTRPDEVNDVTIDKITISGNMFLVEGEGVVSVELQFDSDGDQINGESFKTYDNFPFQFKMTVAYDKTSKLKIMEVDKLSIDTSSYYDHQQSN